MLAFTFDCVAIDARRVAIAGFSDGASYALSVGLANGDLFTHVIAYSPGTVAPPSLRGDPSLFITHGIRDRFDRNGSTDRHLQEIAGNDAQQHVRQVVRRRFRTGARPSRYAAPQAIS